MLTKFWFEILKEGYHAEDLGEDGRIISKQILGKQGWNAWIGFIWLRIRTGGGIL
jgi:hypothetical protein